MKDIKEYINENIRLDEAKKVKLNDVLNGLDEIDSWVSSSNIKKLISSYMSAGDAEEFSKKHWDACVDVVSKISDIIADLHSGSTETIDMDTLSDEVTSAIEDDGFEDEMDKKDPEGDWDVDAMINLFNTVSIKVCKEAWLI